MRKKTTEHAHAAHTKDVPCIFASTGSGIEAQRAVFLLISFERRTPSYTVRMTCACSQMALLLVR
eukprot:3443735-Amphidinium_carterae.1